MARIVVAGGGICGLASALLLVWDGHEVVVLERDESPVPPDVDACWSSWARRSISQFRIAHLMLPRGYQILRAELPDVADRLQQAGGLTFNLVTDALAAIPGATVEADDARFDTTTGRRPTVEWALATAADAEPGVTVRRGVVIQGLVAGTQLLDGVPHVVGVRLADGEEIAADLVIDATGRRSPTADWLVELGGRPPVEESEDIGFTYTGRFWRSLDGTMPATLAPGLMACGSISLLTIPSDNCTWSTTIYAASDDAPMRALRDPAVFERVWRSFAAHAHWLDGEPISDIATMSGAVDRTRRFVVDGAPLVTGMLTIADAAACTNPSLGRGMSLGLLHTVVMRDTLRTHLGDPVELAMAFDAASTAQLEPWHQATKDIDRGRMTEIRACIEGRELEPTPEDQIAAALAGAGAFDVDALRWFTELLTCLTLPMELFARPGVFERVLELAPQVPPPAQYGPDRTQLLELRLMIVLVHGNPETAAIWDPLIAALGRDDVVALSPPGFGAPVPDGWTATSDEYLAWLVAELDAIAGPIDLVGHDWGGGHVQRLAATRPDLIRSWVTDIAGAADPEYVWHDMAQVWQTPGDGEAAVEAMGSVPVDDLAASFVAIGMTPEAARSCAEAATASPDMGRCILALYRSAAQPKMSEWGEQLVAAAHRPGLVIIATEDHFTGGEVLARRSAERFGAQVAVLEGLGHWWMLQDPKAGAAALTAFFATLT